MTHHERIAAIFAGKPTDRPGFWLGNPHADLAKRLYERLGIHPEETEVSDGADVSGIALLTMPSQHEEVLRRVMHDDCRWYPANWTAAYNHPDGRPIFDFSHGVPKGSLGAPGCFAECEDTAEVEKYPWPNADYFDLEPLRAAVAAGGKTWRYGGAWSSFFHEVAEFFGMENYFMKMYTDPDVVHAVTRHTVDFYLALNERVFSEAGDTVDCFFFGNDFGTQEATLMSPDKFREFIMPYFRELISHAKSHGKLVQLHSCGAIFEVIPLLIEAGIDALHPLQAKARGMDAIALAKNFKEDIVFVGGVDTQELMWKGTPQQIKDEVNRLREIFGARWIISPSHEVLMPEVPVENVLALCEAATGVSFA